jgi:hypothetical protein
MTQLLLSRLLTRAARAPAWTDAIYPVFAAPLPASSQLVLGPMAVRVRRAVPTKSRLIKLHPCVSAKNASTGLTKRGATLHGHVVGVCARPKALCRISRIEITISWFVLGSKGQVYNFGQGSTNVEVSQESKS